MRRSFMKKAVSLLVALALFATTAFAAPLSVAASFPEPAQTVTSSASTDIEALFADVAAVPLTDEEAQSVEGEGVVGAIIGGVVGGVIVGFVGGLVGGIIQQNAINNRPEAVKVAVVGGTILGGGAGVFIGAKVGSAIGAFITGPL
jgi:LytS/YehU family sensor histidine kinase